MGTPPATRHTKNFRRQLARYGRRVTVAGVEQDAVWTVANVGHDLELGGLATEAGSASHYISVDASLYDLEGDNPEGELVVDERGDEWTVASVSGEPGDPELRLYLVPEAG